MASLKVDLCPEVLTDKLLDLLRDHFKISTVQDFLDTDQELIASELSIPADDVSKVRRGIFDKLAVHATNLGDVVAAGHLRERQQIPTLLKDLVSSFFILRHFMTLSGSSS